MVSTSRRAPARQDHRVNLVLQVRQETPALQVQVSRSRAPSRAPTRSIHLTQHTGDTWIIGTPVPTVAQPAATGDGIVWDGDSWNNVGPLRGPKGDKGDKGDTGNTGATGATGAKGDKGDQGIQGIQGIQGLQGVQGVKGDTGSTGPVSTVPGPEGPEGDEGPVGPPGLYMSPDPPPTTTLLWADTDEEGTGGTGGGGTGGVSDVWLVDADRGKALAPGAYHGVKWNDQTVTSQPLAALPPGWLYEDTGTTLRFPAGVYAISLTSYAEDRDFSCGLQIRYPYGITTWDNEIYMDTPQASPHSYYKLASVSQTFPLTPWYDEDWDEYYGPYLWFSIERPAAAIGTKTISWQFSMVRLGDIPGYTGPPMGSVDTLMAMETRGGGGPKPRRVPEGMEMVQ